MTALSQQPGLKRWRERNSEGNRQLARIIRANEEMVRIQKRLTRGTSEMLAAGVTYGVMNRFAMFDPQIKARRIDDDGEGCDA